MQKPLCVDSWSYEWRWIEEHGDRCQGHQELVKIQIFVAFFVIVVVIIVRL